MTPIRFTIAALTVALGIALPSGTALAASCVRDGGTALVDSQGYAFDTAPAPGAPTRDHTFATLHDGGSAIAPNAWDDWGALFVGGDDLGHLYFTSDDASCSVDQAGQNLSFPLLAIHGLDVQRELFVSRTGLPGGRLLELVTNPGSTPVTTSVQVGDDQSPNNGGDLGSDATTAVRSSSDGNTLLTSGDLWAVTSDHAGGATNASPALAHVFAGPGAVPRLSAVSLFGADLVPQDNLSYRWDGVLVPPHGTAAFLSYEIPQALPGRDAAAEDAAAKNVALAYQGLPLSHVYAGMTDAEITAVRNWPHPRPVVTIVARGGSDISNIRLSSGGAVSSAGGVCQGATYSWDFGDGTSASGVSVLHRFRAGRRTVTLTVTNSCGASGSNQKTIAISHAPPVVRLSLPRSITLHRLITGRLTFTATSNEDASAAISGAVPKSVARRASRRVKLSPKIISARLRLSAGKPALIRLRLSHRAKVALRTLRHQPFRLTVTAIVRDGAGKITTVRRRVKIR
jgi:hypothetical protein